MDKGGHTSTSNMTGFLGSTGVSSGLLDCNSSNGLKVVFGVWFDELTPDALVLVILKLPRLDISRVFKLSVSVAVVVTLSIRRLRSGRISTDIESADEVALPKLGVRMRFKTVGENPTDD